MNSFIKTTFLLTGLMIHSAAGLQAQTVCSCTIPVDSTFQVAPMTVGLDSNDIGLPPLYENDNATTPAIHLPFDFCFYGQSYDSLFISNNGIISFRKPIHSFIGMGQGLPFGSDTLMIAPFYADANTLNNAGIIYYKLTQTSLIVAWDSVRYAGIDVDGWNTFEMIISNGTDPVLPAGTDVSFCYPVMQWACSETSGGFSGYGGTPAIIGINKGDGIGYAQIGTFSLPGNIYDGPFSQYNGVDWLDFQSFAFNTCVTGNAIPPVIFNDRPACNTLYICPCDTTDTVAFQETSQGTYDIVNTQPCDTVNLNGSFICAVPGQNVILNYTSTGALNITSVDTSSIDSINSITMQVIPVYGDSGTHTITFTAVDTASSLQSTVTYTIVVTTHCMTAGISEPEFMDDFSVYPVPAEKEITVGLNSVKRNTLAKIYNVLGSVMISEKLISDKTIVDISKLVPGIYFISLSAEGIPLEGKKIIVQ